MKRLKDFIIQHKIEIFFLIFGLIIRIPSLIWEPPFWDESFSWVISQNSLIGIIGATARDTHPPLYYEILKVWNYIFSDSIVSMRMLSIIFWILSLGAVFFIVKNLTSSTNKKILIYGIISILPITIWMSTFVRMYSMALTFILFAVIVLNEYLKSYRLKFLVLFSMFSILALYTENISLFALIGINIFILLHFFFSNKAGIRDKFLLLIKNNDFIKYIISQFIVVVLYLPWLLVILKQSSGASVKQIAWIDPISFKSIIQLPLLITGYPDNSYIYIMLLILIYVSIMFAIFFNKQKDSSKKTLFYILLSLSLGSIIIITLFSIKQSVYISRTFFLVSVPLVICLITSIKIKNFKTLSYILLILFLWQGSSIFTDAYNRLKDSDGEQNMIEFLKPVNENNDIDLIITRQQAQYPIAYQQIKYLTRSNPKEIKLDKETDTGDYIIYGKQDFVDLNTLNQDFFYINYTEDNKCNYLNKFVISFDIHFEEVGRKAEICKYEFIK